MIILSDGVFITEDFNQDIQVSISEYEPIDPDIPIRPINLEIEERDRIAFDLEPIYSIPQISTGGSSAYTDIELKNMLEKELKKNKYDNNPNQVASKVKEIIGEGEKKRDELSIFDIIFDIFRFQDNEEEKPGENEDACKCGNCESESGRDDLCDSCKDIESFDDEEEEEFFVDPDDFTDGV